MPEFNKPLQPGGTDPGDDEAALRGRHPLIPGFFARLGALIIDFVVLYVLAMAANSLLRGTLLEAGRSTSVLAMVVMIAYFTVSHGPVAKGVTLGKSILDIRVVGRGGQVLGWRAALMRALIETAPVWGLHGIVALTWNSNFSVASWLGLQSTLQLLEGFLIANAMLVILSPIKRSFQDLAAGSLVVRSTYYTEPLNTAVGHVLGQTPPLSAFQKGMVGVGLLIVLATSLPAEIDAVRSGQWQEAREKMAELKQMIGAERFEIGFKRAQNVPVGGPEAEAREAELRRAREEITPGPRLLRHTITLTEYEKLSEQELEDLQDLQGAMPRIAEWFTELFLAQQEAARQRATADDPVQDYAESLRAMNVQQIELILQVLETLDIGYEYTGAPQLEFRYSFTAEQLAAFGITPTAATQPLRPEN